MSADSTDPIVTALERIEDKLPTVDPGHLAPEAFNALTTDQLVALQESDPARYERSLHAAAAAPSTEPAPRYAEAPSGVIPAADFNRLSASDLAEVHEADPGLYERSLEHWSTHEQEVG